jgi:hypothetical protein
MDSKGYILWQAPPFMGWLLHPTTEVHRLVGVGLGQAGR